MGTKSASNILHNILVQHEIGYEFDVRDLEEEANNYGYDFSEGAIGGFITRAIDKKIVSVKGTIRPKGQARTRRVYTLVDKQDWRFMPAGVGSYPGREIHGKTRSNDQLELIEDQYKSSIIRDTAEKMGIPIINIPMSDHNVDALIGMPIIEPKREFTPEELSLGEQLMVLAHKVMHLEDKPEKSLADYSTNELLDEIRSRLK